MKSFCLGQNWSKKCIKFHRPFRKMMIKPFLSSYKNLCQVTNLEPSNLRTIYSVLIPLIKLQSKAPAIQINYLLSFEIR